MTGHGNHFQFAVTESDLPDPWLLGFNDILQGSALHQLTNDAPIVAVQLDLKTGTTIDECLLRHANGGGAVAAVWGGAGLTSCMDRMHYRRDFTGHFGKSRSTPSFGSLGQLGCLTLLRNQYSCHYLYADASSRYKFSGIIHRFD